MLLAQRPELFGGLRGNDVIVSVEIKSRFSASVPCQQAYGRLSAIFFQVGGFDTLAWRRPPDGYRPSAGLPTPAAPPLLPAPDVLTQPSGERRAVPGGLAQTAQ